MKTIALKYVLIVCLLCSNFAAAQEDEAFAAEREQLLSLLEKVETAINNKDLNSIKDSIDPQAIITFHDAKVAKGVSALEDYFEEKLGGSSAVLKDFSTTATVDAPAVFYDGNIAIAYGHSVDNFVFATGNEFELTSRWTVTLRKDQADWKVVALHFSVNMFDNPLLNTAKNNFMAFAIIALILGMLIAFVVARLIYKK